MVKWPSAVWIAVALSAPLLGACVAAKPVALTHASPESAELVLLLEVGSDELGPETGTALEQTLVAAGYRVTRVASDAHDAALRLRASGEEVQSVLQTYENGVLQRTYHVTGSLAVLQGAGPKEGTVLATLPVDFECDNRMIGRAEVTPLANALGADPMFVALGKRVKFDRSLAPPKP